jgi:hypothetical protein
MTKEEGLKIENGDTWREILLNADSLLRLEYCTGNNLLTMSLLEWNVHAYFPQRNKSKY